MNPSIPKTEIKDEKGKGHIHPLSQILIELLPAFEELGFEIAEGPEIETEFYNFDSLNVPKDHPARDMQDTFWLMPEAARRLLRTHTSPVQTRTMEKQVPPIRIIAPGRVFRQEGTDATHEAQFHQIEGLVVDKHVSLAELKGTLLAFFRKVFGPDADIRFRPSYFPFVEPGVEVDVKWNGKWLEIMGAGVVHPNVFRAVGLDPNEWKGYAFGGGIDRFALLKYGIPDIRMLYAGDTRLTDQF